MFEQHIIYIQNQKNQHTNILFINDVKTTANDMFNLINGKQQYDMMCGTDFEGFGLYDLWVARDRWGKFLSFSFPYFQEMGSRNLMLLGEPVPMYSCWNGMVSINATTLGNQLFRSWKEGENRSPKMNVAVKAKEKERQKTENGKMNQNVNKKDQIEKFGRENGRCAVSECQLICKDLWTQTQNKAKIYMHPGVKLYYNDWSVFVHGWIAPVTEMFIRWKWNVVEMFSMSLTEERYVEYPIGAPEHVPCGRGTDGCGDSGRVLVPEGHECRYV